VNRYFLPGNASVGRSGRREGGRNGFVQRKQQNSREESRNGVNSNAGAALLPVPTKLRAILDQH
jgi:hypothetical protein